MKKWSFMITSGYDNYLRGFVKDSMSEDFFFYEEGSDEDANLTYFFSSSHLNHLSDLEDVYQWGQQLKLLFDGFSYLIHEDPKEYRPLKIGRLINNKTGDIYDLDNIEFESKFLIDFRINETKNPGGRSYDEILHISTKDQFVLNLLLIFSNGKNFKSMYQALDDIIFFLKQKQNSLKNLGFSKSVISAFTHTANSFSVLGRDARHGRQKGQPPTKPMTLEQAQTLIFEIVHKVLEQYYNVDLPIKNSFKIDWNTIDLGLDDF